MSDPILDLRPRPVRTAARIVGAVAAIAGATPTFLIAFEVIAWTGEQVAAYGTFLGVVIGSLSLILGGQVEQVVTPVSDPMSDALTPLVPIADDGFED